MTRTFRKQRSIEREDVWNRKRPFFASKSLNGWGFSAKSWLKQKSMKRQKQKWLQIELQLKDEKKNREE